MTTPPVLLSPLPHSGVCDTSPLVYLFRIELLDVLPELFNHIFVPRGVCREVEIGRRTGKKCPVLESYKWVDEVNEDHAPSVSINTEDLQDGEIAAIKVAHSVTDCALLIDERPGDREAKRLGIRTHGTFGILLYAKADGLIDEVRPFVDMLPKVGHHSTPELRQEVLRRAGEL